MTWNCPGAVTEVLAFVLVGEEFSLLPVDEPAVLVAIEMPCWAMLFSFEMGGAAATICQEPPAS